MARKDDYQNLLEARAIAEGMYDLFGNIDGPVEGVTGYSLMVMMEPIIERLSAVLGDRPTPSE